MSRVMASHSHNMSLVEVSRSLSAPITSATSHAPDATPNSALRTASLPVAQEFSTRVTGNSGNPSVSARIPDGNPSVVPIEPNQAAWSSVLASPLSTLAAHSAKAIGSRSLMPRAKCSAKGVMPAPTMATFFMPAPFALCWRGRRLPRGPDWISRRLRGSRDYGSRCVPFGCKRETVIGNAGSHSDAAQRQATAVADAHRPGLGAGHFRQRPNTHAVEFDDHQGIGSLQPRNRNVNGHLGVDGARAGKRFQFIASAQSSVGGDPVPGREVQLVAAGEPAGLPANLGLERALVCGERDRDVSARHERAVG